MLGWNANGEALIAPAVARNRDAILEVLRRVVPEDGLVLELASGSGEHAIYFARNLSHLTWQPSDPSEQALASIAAHRREAGLPNLLPPIALDATWPTWPIDHADAVVAINMIHIAPWQATEGLMAEAARILPHGGPLYLYGPYKENDLQTAESNSAFDEDLRRRNPTWGVRNVEDVSRAASRNGLRLVERIAMPANNLSLVFQRST